MQEATARNLYDDVYHIEGFVKSEYAGAEKLTFSVFTLGGVFAGNGDDYLDNGNFLESVTSGVLADANGIRLTRCDMGLGSGANPPTDYQWNRV